MASPNAVANCSKLLLSQSEVGAHAAWLIAQHADRRPAFQRRCLKLLTHAVASGEASAAGLTHLTDRVARLMYPESVDARRAAMGLAALADQLGHARERFGTPRPTHVAYPGCGREIEMWLPEPGGSTPVRCHACGLTGTMRTRLRTATSAKR